MENEDEFDHYMEEALMQEADSLGIFDASKQAIDADVYSQALKRVEQEVAKVPSKAEEEETKGPRKEENAAGNEDGEDLDKFGDDLMSKMMAEDSQNESNYVTEYNEVIAEISQICGHILANTKG